MDGLVWFGVVPKINVIFDIPKKRRFFLNFFVECHPNVTRTAGPGMLPHFVRIVETLNEPYLTVMKKYLLWICTAAALLAAGTSCTDDPEVDSVGRVGIQQQSLTASGDGEVLTLNVTSNAYWHLEFVDAATGESIRWVLPNESTGMGNADVKLTVARNRSTNGRSALCERDHRFGVLDGFDPAVAGSRHGRRRRPGMISRSPSGSASTPTSHWTMPLSRERPATSTTA